MIEIVDGIGVGSGKSFFVMTRCLAHFLRGGTVYSTDEFELKMSEIIAYAKEKYGVILEEDQYRVVSRELATRLHEHTAPGTDDCPVLVIIDEAQDYFDVRDHADKSKREFFSWCTQSRHDNNDVILITQDANNIDARFRRLATHRVTVRNTQTWKIPGMGSIASLIQMGTLWTNDGWYFAVHYYDRDGRTLFERKWVKARQELFNLYVSKSRAGAHRRAGLPVEKRNLQKVETKDKPMIKYIIFGGILACLCALGFVIYRFSNGSILGTGKEQAAAPISTKAAPSRPLLPDTPGTGFSEQKKAAYRIVEEPFRSTFRYAGATVLRTARGDYRPGTMSIHGFVVGVDFDGRVAKAKGPDGMDVYIVCIDDERKIDPVPADPASEASPALEIAKAEKEAAVVNSNAAPSYMGYGEMIATGHGTSAHLDFMQARVTDGKHKVSQDRPAWFPKKEKD